MYRRLSPRQQAERDRRREAMRRWRERAAMAREPRGRMPDLPDLRREVVVIDYDAGQPITHTLHLYRTRRVVAAAAVTSASSSASASMTSAAVMSSRGSHGAR